MHLLYSFKRSVKTARNRNTNAICRKWAANILVTPRPPIAYLTT